MDPRPRCQWVKPHRPSGKGSIPVDRGYVKNWIKTKLTSGTFSKRAPSSAPLNTERDQLTRSGVDPRLAVPGIILGRKV